MLYADRVSIAPDVPPDAASSDEQAPSASHRGAGHDAITKAAREILAERGYHGTSIRDIAKLAGLSLSALYYWYPSKQHLLAALIEDSDRLYHTECDKALRAAGDDPAARLRALVRVTVEYCAERQIERNIAVREYRNLEPESTAHLAKQARAATRMWAEVINDGIASGTFHCAYPDDARRTILAACNAIAQWYKPGGKLTTADLVDRYTEIALRVVDARATRRRTPSAAAKKPAARRRG